MAVPDWIEIVNKLGTPSVALASAIYAYLQYRRARKWKSQDLAATLLEKLSSDQQLALACHALDWGLGPLIVPEHQRELLRKPGRENLPALIEHDPALLCEAVQPQLTAKTLTDPRGLIYRLAFIKFFEHLNNIARLVESDQLSIADLRALEYWLKALRSYAYAPIGIDKESVFAPAIREWEYEGVLDLARKLGVVGWKRPSGA